MSARTISPPFLLLQILQTNQFPERKTEKEVGTETQFIFQIIQLDTLYSSKADLQIYVIYIFPHKHDLYFVEPFACLSLESQFSKVCLSWQVGFSFTLLS